MSPEWTFSCTRRDATSRIPTHCSNRNPCTKLTVRCPPLPRVDLVHPPPYGEVPFKHLGLCYVAAGLRAEGFETRYHDFSERHHRAGTDFYDELVLRLSLQAGDMSDLPFAGPARRGAADRYSNRVNESRHQLGALHHAQNGAGIARLAEISYEIRGRWTNLCQLTRDASGQHITHTHRDKVGRRRRSC